MNVAFCCWLWSRAAHGDQVEIMAHEPYLPFGRNWRQCGAALVHRLMTIVLLRGVTRVWISIPEWERRWRPYALGRKLAFQWLPIPSGIPVLDCRDGVEVVRRRYVSDDGQLLAHFGTYGWPITSLLEPILFALADKPANQTVLLMGIGSEEFRETLIRRRPDLAGIVLATGALSPQELSRHVTACDLLIQPYPDGVSSRRTSFMVGLSHGKPIVTTIGALSEPLWKESDALALAPAGDAEKFVSQVRKLGADMSERRRMGLAARRLYEERFDISYTLAALRGAAGIVEPMVCAS
jgi:glycosyltransferase involved in cell wall biosynthesis